MGITIRRGVLPADGFTIVPNDYARDSRLSFAARGLLVWLMSHRPGYEVTEDRIIAASAAKRDGVRTMVRELEEHGYLHRERAVIPGAGSTVAYVLSDGLSVAQDDGISVARAEQAKHDVSAGGTDDGKSVLLLSVEDQEKTKTPSVSTRERATDRGTRLPEDFMPDEKMRQWYAAEKLEEVINGRIEHQKFVNYWCSKPGAGGRKTDWRRTWMNWMLTAGEDAGRRPGRALAPTSGAPYRPSTTDQKVAQTLELGRRLQAMEDAK